MEPVIGLDVAKGKSVIQAFLKRNEAYGKSETITHTEEGFRRLSNVVQELYKRTEVEPVVILEATGHYHRAVEVFLSASKIPHFLLDQVFPAYRGYSATSFLQRH